MLQNYPNPVRKDVARADIHVHSKYSDRPSEWLLRRIGAPESFTEPLTIYRRCRERGMDFVTVSDHNCIEAALEIAHLPGTFLASEVTTYFPENGCKVHCLVLGFNEEQFREIQRVRQNIYDFRRYVVEQDIIYSLAHPLFRVNDRLSVDQVEKLLLLFNRFEGINGTRDPRAAELVRAIFRQITPELMAEMASRHGIEPLGPEPWRKTFTGGSDDHGSLYIASAWTETPPGRGVDEYLEHIRQGRHEMGGDSGTSLRLAHSFYHIAYSFYKERLIDNSSEFNLIGELFRQLLEHSEPSTATLPDRVRGIAGRFMLGAARHFSPMEQMLVTEISDLFTKQREVQHDTLPAAPDAADDQPQLPGGLRHQPEIGLCLSAKGHPARERGAFHRKPAIAGFAGAGGHEHRPVPGGFSHAAQRRTVLAGGRRSLSNHRQPAIQKREAGVDYRYVRRRQRRGAHHSVAGARGPRDRPPVDGYHLSLHTAGR